MLGRAKTLMRGWVAAGPPAATPYNVACANGHRLRGDRTEGYQALRCPTCGEAVFILPQSPLPEPTVPASVASPSRSRATNQAILDAYVDDDAPHALVDPPAWTGGSVASASAAGSVAATDDVADIDWVDEVKSPDPVQTPQSRESPAAKPAPARPAGAGPRAMRPVPAPATPTPEVDRAPRPTLREWAWTHRNPLLAVGLALLICGAVAFKVRRQRLEELPRIAEIGRTEGFKKLDAGDFFAAKKILADAVAAVDALGGRIEGADAIRQGAAEAAIFTDLVPRTLEDLVDEAMTYDDVKGWTSHFTSMYQGRSIIIETTITAVPDPTRPGSAYGDAYRVVIGRGPKPAAIGRIDYTGFKLFELAEPKLGEVKLFGARLAALEFDKTENLWRFTLEPDSGAFITHTEALAAIHWPGNELVEEPPP